MLPVRTLFILLLALPIASMSQDLTWVGQHTGLGTNLCHDVWADANQNVYVVGDFLFDIDVDMGSDTTNLPNNGLTDAFLARYDAGGNLAWAFSVGGGLTDEFSSVDGDDFGNLYISGKFNGTVELS